MPALYAVAAFAWFVTFFYTCTQAPAILETLKHLAQ